MMIIVSTNSAVAVVVVCCVSDADEVDSSSLTNHPSPPPLLPASASSVHSPNLIVFGREVLGARECGVASSERVRVIRGEDCKRLPGIASIMNTEVTPKHRTMSCIAVHCVCRGLAFKARGRVVVRILHQEQKTPGCCGILTTMKSPRCVGVASERVPRGGAHDDQCRPLQLQRYKTQP